MSDVIQTVSANNNDASLDTQQTEFRPTFLETLLLIIRGITIKSTSFEKKQQQEEIRFEQEIKIIEEEVYTNFINISDESLDNLETKKTMLYDIQKIKWCSDQDDEDLGEKLTHSFFNLEDKLYKSSNQLSG